MTEAQEAGTGLWYTCDACGKRFESAWTDEEATGEAQALFGPDASKDNPAYCVICHSCWEEMRRRGYF
jgi:hypothetical protein